MFAAYRAAMRAYWAVRSQNAFEMNECGAFIMKVRSGRCGNVRHVIDSYCGIELRTATVVCQLRSRPDPVTFFYKRYQKIYAFYFKVDISENEYYSIRWHDPKTPANYPKPIQFNTEIETYIPSSTSWAMWGERSREIAVIGLMTRY